MDYQDKTRWLHRYLDSLRAEKELMLERERLRSEAENISPVLSGMPSGGSDGDKLPRAVERIVEADQRLACQINVRMAQRSEILDAVEQLPNQRQQEILRRRYILGQRWERIAVDMDIDYHWVWVLHKRAVEHLTIESHIPPVL